MNFDTFFPDIIATLIGGIILAVLFFWFREKVVPLPGITGRWYIEIQTVKTAYKPYQGMILRYIAMIWCEGNRVTGTVEKIYENSSTGEREYVGNTRTRGKLEGYIEKNYFGKDEVFLNIVEDGHGRESTNFYELVANSKETMKGKFFSMVADQEGTVTWQRKEF